MDEPLGALDAEFRELMCGELRTLHERLHATTLYVTHDPARSHVDGPIRIIVMNHGVIEQVGAPREIYDRPRTMFVADFIGSPPMSFLRFEGAVQAGQSSIAIGGAAVAVPALRESRHYGPLALGVRPERVRFSDASALRGAVFGTEYLGTTQIVTVETDHGQLRARVPSRERVAPGENVGIECAPNVWWCSTRRAATPSTATCTGEACMADVSLRGVTGVLRRAGRVHARAASGVRRGRRSHPRRRPVPECPAWLTCR